MTHDERAQLEREANEVVGKCEKFIDEMNNIGVNVMVNFMKHPYADGKTEKHESMLAGSLYKEVNTPCGQEVNKLQKEAERLAMSIIAAKSLREHFGRYMPKAVALALGRETIHNELGDMELLDDSKGELVQLIAEHLALVFAKASLAMLIYDKVADLRPEHIDEIKKKLKGEG